MVEDEFRFGNIPAVLFVNVKGMKEVVRYGAVCLDYTFADYTFICFVYGAALLVLHIIWTICMPAFCLYISLVFYCI